MNKIIGVEGKCGVGKSTYLVEIGVLSPEFADFHIDEATYNKELGMISFDEQLKFVEYKINEFKEKYEKLQTQTEDLYMDRQVLSPIAFGAGYYKWYGLSDEQINEYLSSCYELLNNMPEDWRNCLEILLLVPEDESDIRYRIMNRGRDFEVTRIEDIICVNNYYIDYLMDLLSKYDIPYKKKVIVQHN